MSFVFSTIALAANHTVLVISDTESKIHDQVVNELQNQQFTEQAFNIEYRRLDQVNSNALRQNNIALVITLGYQAALLANRSDMVTLNTLLPKQSMADEKLCILAQCPELPRHYGLYLDQPIARQLNLLTTTLSGVKSVGVLTADFSVNKLEALKEQGKQRHLQINNRSVSSASEINNQLNELVKESDVLLALPDPLIHNRRTIPYLLLTSYRYNVPVIGFSKAYVNAGAIAAVYSSPRQIARHIWELATRILLAPKSMKQRTYPPKYFSVNINRNVARSLEFHLPESEQIKLKLLRLEK
ncbi:ABC transporter substrate binding protein [Methylomarinum sp. Ch1-1]|uniref:ABC transporter substrate binding protein n=1 Tax=Methylomarinum roseum TaxID=3067653 RepID=A0AAU7NZH4_9GAMM|nr:ABC transporter substrate binding protein [Methylomarinum sp. Ch1-1]MDP4521952.1 ABC transporter substrate binding protein [Methylomarinum sp. Ch1-1]